MKKIIFMLGSSTYASKAKRALTRNGISAEYIKSTDSRNLGCSHGIEISYHDFIDAVAILKKENIQYSVKNI